MSEHASFRPLIRFAFSASLIACTAFPCRAQDEAVVDALAQVLAAEDARAYDASLFASLARDASAVVRRHVALALGRIGDRRGGPLLAHLAVDPEPFVRLEAVFAIGLLGDPAGIPQLRELIFNAPVGSCENLCPEAAAAASRIGGPEGGALIRDVLTRSFGLATSGNVPTVVSRALREAWRLEAHAPIPILMQYAETRQRETRGPAVYSLGRLRAGDAATVLLAATEDSDPLVRAWAVRTLDATYADSAHINQNAVAARVEQLVVDPDPHVRIHALRSLGTFQSARHAALIAERAGDGDPNVRVQALMALGQQEGPAIVDALTTHLKGGVYATRREALVSLARVQGAAALPAIQEWAHAGQWHERLVATRAVGEIGVAGAAMLRTFIRDPDPRVVAAALPLLIALDTLAVDSLVLHFADHDDPGVRAAVFRMVQGRPQRLHIPLLLAGYRRAAADQTDGARLAIIGALASLSETFPAEQTVRRFTEQFPVERDSRARALAANLLPDLARVWGAARPMATGMGLEDYRDLARELLLPAEQDATRPSVIIETGRGNIIIELFAQDAPLATQSFLDLADRRFFDGHRWHRVVPAFVIQDGDPRGDGTGGPGYTLRDEVNRRSYERGTVGMARSGPDTGGSQFFITLSPQPHLEGAYTVFGQVVSGLDVMDRITQGDRVRRLRRW